MSHFSFSVMSETSDFYARMESNIALLPKLVESVSDVRASVSDVRASVTVVEERTKVISDRLDGVASLVLEHEAKLQALHTNRTETDKRLETLEQQLAELRNTQAASVTVTQQLQAEIHDIYAAAAARNKEFLSVFLFMLCYGFDTTKGRVCGVFATVNNVPCVCVNLRALNVIAKMYLACPSYAKRFPDLPSFGLFRINALQKTFDKADLPCQKISTAISKKLFRKLPFYALKSDRGNLTSWVALELLPFKAGIEALKEKCKEFYLKVQAKFRKGLPVVKVIGEKDNARVDFEGSEWPVFNQMWWKGLFYLRMREFVGHPDDCHFLSFLCFRHSEEVPVEDEEDLEEKKFDKEPSGRWLLHEEQPEQSDSDEGSPPKPKRAAKKRKATRPPESEEEDEAPQTARPTTGGKKPRFNLSSVSAAPAEGDDGSSSE